MLNSSILYVFTQAGCQACALMRPRLEALRQKYLGQLLVLELDVARHDSLDGYQPHSTPAFALKVGGAMIKTHEGLISQAQLEKFVTSEVSDEARPRRRRRRTSKVGSEPSDPRGDRADEPSDGDTT